MQKFSLTFDQLAFDNNTQQLYVVGRFSAIEYGAQCGTPRLSTADLWLLQTNDRLMMSCALRHSAPLHLPCMSHTIYPIGAADMICNCWPFLSLAPVVTAARYAAHHQQQQQQWFTTAPAVSSCGPPVWWCLCPCSRGSRWQPRTPPASLTQGEHHWLAGWGLTAAAEAAVHLTHHIIIAAYLLAGGTLLQVCSKSLT